MINDVEYGREVRTQEIPSVHPLWLAVFKLGFALLLGPSIGSAGLSGAFHLACTLGYLAPSRGAQKGGVDVASLMGLGTVALQIGYLPTVFAGANQ